MKGGEIKFADVGGVRTRYWEAGAGEPMVLVHGGQFGELCSLDSWDLNFDELSQDYHLVALDRLGQGFTDNPSDSAGYTSEAVNAHAIAFLHTLGLGPSHLVGHSRGGFVVTRVAIERPDLARTVTIVDSGTTAPEDPDYPSATFYDELERQLAGEPPSPDNARVEVELQSLSHDHITDDFIARLSEISLLPKIREAHDTLQEVRWSVWEPSIESKRQETLDVIGREGIPVPTLIVWGRNDPSALLPWGVKLYEHICTHTDRAELHVFNRAGHYCFREQPRAFAAVLRSFCA